MKAMILKKIGFHQKARRAGPPSKTSPVRMNPCPTNGKRVFGRGKPAKQDVYKVGFIEEGIKMYRILCIYPVRTYHGYPYLPIIKMRPREVPE